MLTDEHLTRLESFLARTDPDEKNEAGEAVSDRQREWDELNHIVAELRKSLPKGSTGSIKISVVE